MSAFSTNGSADRARDTYREALRETGERAPGESSAAHGHGATECGVGSGAFAVGLAGFPFWKRVLDLTAILMSLPCWLPLMLAVSAWIRAVSPGPVFYRQERVGYRGKRFVIVKFRTMKVDAETVSHERHLSHLIQADRPMLKLDVIGDARIIHGGRLLRAMGLDELPQLFNVLRGDMSLVGPRPCMAHELLRYRPAHHERFHAPPGLTGFWQVNGKNRTTFSEMVSMDIYYVRNMSPWLDLEIVLKTFPALLTQVLESCLAGGPEGANGSTTNGMKTKWKFGTTRSR